jgi:competence protein ComEC
VGAVRRLLPALALAQAAGIAAADRGWLRADAALGLGVAACGLALPLARRPRARVALCLVAAAAGGAVALARQVEAADATRPALPVELTLEATVREVAAIDPAVSRVELEGAVAVEPPGARVSPRVRLWLAVDPLAPPGLERALPGERIRARVRLAAPASRRNPGAVDAARRARRAGIGAVGRLADPSLVVRLPEREGPRPLAPVHALRARAGHRLAAFGSGGDLLRALALGEQAALAAPVREAFAALGISHLLSVSGLHLVLVAALAFGAARRVLARAAPLAARHDVRRPALAFAVAAAAGYAALAGGGVPVRRSLALLVALAVAAAARRPGAWGPSLAAASVAILAVEPEALFDAGAQLSFAGSAALASRGARGAPGAAGAPGRSAALADGLRTSATALLATAPIAALHFGRSAPFALLANAIAVPWTGLVLLPGALASAGLALTPPHPLVDGGLALAAAIAAASLRACMALASWLPAPGAGAPPGALGIGLAAALAAAGLRARSTAARVALASALGAVLALAPPAAVAPAAPRAVFFDVGQGDAALVQSADAAILVDAGGGSRTGRDAGLATVVPALRALGVRRLDLLVVSHADLDHRGGAPAVLGGLPVGEVWVPLGARRDPAFAALRAAAGSRGATLRERGAGSRAFERGGLRATPIWPPPGAAHASRNDRSLVVRVEVAGRRVLLPGDLEAEGEAALLAAEVDLRADVLKLAHHGSRTSSTPAFLAAVGASVAVASAPCAGRFGMPHPEVVRRARERGAALWWTGRDGAVRIGLGPRLHALGTGDALACGRARDGAPR